MAAGDALMRALGQSRGRGVERGVRGRELRFQQNRNFGPGPIVPYPNRAREPEQRRSPLAGLRGGVQAGRGY
jgi:hypothetical protein